MSKHAPHITDALGHPSTDRRLDILGRIAEVGSISQAARAAGVSYKAAWQAIDTLSNLAGIPLVEKLVGGAGGGGAHLTDAGRSLLNVAQKMQEARLQLLQTQPGGAAPPDGPSAMWALGLRTSMRNQLPCTVASIRKQAGAVRVDLRLADATLLCSRITHESAELLNLRAGLSVLALCKATGVTVATSAEPRADLNLLRGRVSRATRSKLGGEVALALPSGLQLVGFCAPGAPLKVGSSAVATLDHASLVLALPQ